jgi:hypothetical protein
MAFKRILLEHMDPATSAVVPGVVPATPAALTTPFYDATLLGTTPDPGPDGLQQALTNLINSKPAYKNVGKTSPSRWSTSLAPTNSLPSTPGSMT